MTDKKEKLSLETVGIINCIIECGVLFSLLKDKGIITDAEYQERYEKVSKEITKNLKEKNGNG